MDLCLDIFGFRNGLTGAIPRFHRDWVVLLRRYDWLIGYEPGLFGWLSGVALLDVYSPAVAFLVIFCHFRLVLGLAFLSFLKDYFYFLVSASGNPGRQIRLLPARNEMFGSFELFGGFYRSTPLLQVLSF